MNTARLECFLASARGSCVSREVNGDRAILRGRCASYLEGTIRL